MGNNRAVTLRDLQLSILEVYEVVQNICKKNNLHYIAFAGTCLGAIRHKGFIPWDDDADIALPRDEYEKFIELCKNGALGEKYTLQIYGEDEPHYDQMWIRIRKNNTLLVIPYHKSKCWNNLGVFVDVFPLDTSSKNDLKYIQHFKKRYDFARKLFSNKISKTHNTFASKILSIFLKPFSTEYLRDLPIKIAKKMCKSGSPKCYVFLNSIEPINKCVLPLFDLNRRIIVPFENTSTFVPFEYKEMLSILYGDYMKLPPVEKRKGHLPDEISL